MKTALFFAIACCGAVACGGGDQRARTPVSTTTTTSGEQPVSSSPSSPVMIGYGPGESHERANDTSSGDVPGGGIPVPDRTTEVPGDATMDGGSR